MLPPVTSAAEANGLTVGAELRLDRLQRGLCDREHGSGRGGRQPTGVDQDRRVGQVDRLPAGELGGDGGDGVGAGPAGRADQRLQAGQVVVGGEDALGDFLAEGPRGRAEQATLCVEGWRGRCRGTRSSAVSTRVCAAATPPALVSPLASATASTRVVSGDRTVAPAGGGQGAGESEAGGAVGAAGQHDRPGAPGQREAAIRPGHRRGAGAVLVADGPHRRYSRPGRCRPWPSCRSCRLCCCRHKPRRCRRRRCRPARQWRGCR